MAGVMGIKSTWLVLLGTWLLGPFFLHGQCADIIVSKNGSGDVKTIQEAIDLCPTGLSEPFVIYIEKGVYDEKLFIEKNYLCFIGEDRDSTIITTAVLRREWRETHPSDWGAATVNIDQNASDLTFANLTIRNNFAEVYPDFPDNHDHTFAIRGGGNRVILFNCNIIASGGDTLSLWNTEGGMFYHNACYFEGYVDYVCPRGYCYITDSRFYGYNTHASIWHDGSGGKDHKFVIRNSRFDGIKGFALGRHHRDAAFYLLDCSFSDDMKTSQGIVYVGTEGLQWGQRYYYHNVHRELIDFSWHKDNLDEAEGSPESEEVTPLWTFRGEWDPESKLDYLLPAASLPSPANKSACVALESPLSWKPGFCSVGHRIFFGTDPNPPLVHEDSLSAWQPGLLEPGTTYFWRVDEITEKGTVEGSVWSFTTQSDLGLPYPVFDPEPADGTDYFTNLVKLNWNYFGCSTDSFYVFTGFDPGQLDYQASQKYPGYFIFQGKKDSTYYWRVDAKNSHGITEGPVWSFTLNPQTSGVYPEQEKKSLRIENWFPNPGRHSQTISYFIPESGMVRIALQSLNGDHTIPLLNEFRESGWQSETLMIPDNIQNGMFLLLLHLDGSDPAQRKVIFQH